MAKKIIKSIARPPTTSEVGYKKPPKHSRFKKGVNPNPNNIRKPKAVRAMEKLSEQTLQQVIELVMTGSMKDLKDALQNPDVSFAHRVILKAALKAEKDGSFYQLNEILNRAIGTVKQKIDHSSEDGSMSPTREVVNFYIPENKRDNET